ncbi:uncharacterized protein LOC118436927 [Folsomia candida]|uniref:uncharacterized protein LOC118436927 n=1 Tax=Folsomia candida TaxID=158441 RepID=UPI0016055444|nr:uncharacterized protein LOC118436927 [Folsomia candida]
MLNQLAGQLVKLSFSFHMQQETSLSNVLGGPHNFDTATQSNFRLPRMMSKLQLFRNDLVDIFQCADDLLESMPALETLLIGGTIRKARYVEEIVQNICHARKIWPNLRNLRIIELHDPQLLEGLKTAFPNLVRLQLETYYRTDFRREVSKMEYPEEIGDVIKILLDCKELFTQLKTLQIKHYGLWSRADFDLTEDEIDLFKQLLIAMNGMDEVKICQVYLCDKAAETMLAFMKAIKMSTSRFMIIQRGTMFT